MDLHLSLDGPGTLRCRLERELREAIRSGRLPRGARLPSSRDLAQELGLSRGVVTEAYSQLVAEGNLTARRGGGTRVSDSAESPATSDPASRTGARPATPDRIEYDLRPGLPDASAFPRQAWRAASNRALHGLQDAALVYGNPRGSSRLRSSLSVYLGRARAARSAPAHIVPCSGMTHGLTLVGRVLQRGGARRVAVEDPGWPAHRASLAAADLEPMPVPVDDQGIRVDLLDALDVAAVIVTPAHQYPTGAVLSPDRRNGLVAWAHARSALIIEDDYDAEYRYGTEPVSPSTSGRRTATVIRLTAHNRASSSVMSTSHTTSFARRGGGGRPHGRGARSGPCCHRLPNDVDPGKRQSCSDLVQRERLFDAVDAGRRGPVARLHRAKQHDRRPRGTDEVTAALNRAGRQSFSHRAEPAAVGLGKPQALHGARGSGREAATGPQDGPAPDSSALATKLPSTPVAPRTRTVGSRCLVMWPTVRRTWIIGQSQVRGVRTSQLPVADMGTRQEINARRPAHASCPVMPYNDVR